MIEEDVQEKYDIKVYEGGYGLFSSSLLQSQPEYYKQVGQVNRFGEIVDLEGGRIYPKLPVSIEERVVGAFFEKPVDHLKQINAYHLKDGTFRLDVTMPDSDGIHSRNYDCRVNLKFANDEVEKVVCLKSSTSALDWALGGRESPTVQTHLIVTRKE